MGAMKGLLRVSGTLDLSQFWPNGKSDADTATVVANVDGFEFSLDGSLQRLRRTRVFEGAQIAGKNVIKTDRKVTIRIQGIDAPELHCPPGVRKPVAKFAGSSPVRLSRNATMLRVSSPPLEVYMSPVSAPVPARLVASQSRAHYSNP